MNPRALFVLGTGVGIQIQAHDLEVTVVRVRPTGTSVLGCTRIHAFHERPAAEWGEEYAEFLRGVGARHLAATVLLPRTEVIVRHLSLPGVPQRDLASAVPLQVDSLHPYGEDEASYGWAPLEGAGSVLLAIARKAVIEKYSRLFVEAGLKIASFSCSAASIYSALRLFSAPPADGFLAVGGAPEVEAYGESTARPLLSALLAPPVERGAALAAAELRLEPPAEPGSLADLLPKPSSAPAEFDPAASALSYAAALSAAMPRRSLKVNLLPVELRSSNSRLFLVPTVALATILVALAASLAGQGPYEQRRQLSLLEAEIARVEPRARKAEAAEKSIEQLRGRIRLLDGFQGRTASDLEMLNEITRLLSPPGWLSGLEIEGNTVTLSGQAEQAAPLLKLLDSSRWFRDSEFVGAIGKSEKNEVFRIRTTKEGPLP